MTRVDLSNWNFDIDGTAQSFAGSVDLLRYLSDHDIASLTPIQNGFVARIKNDPAAREWKANRTPLNATPHFKKYRGNDYDAYHQAARERSAGAASEKQLGMANGLDAEVMASRIIVPAGQIVFHGRANRDLTTIQPYPAFLSTSLDATVAYHSSLRRAGEKHVNGTPTVYALTLDCPLPAMWGQVGNSSENELFLGSNIRCRQTSAYSGKKFDLIEAIIWR